MGTTTPDVPDTAASDVASWTEQLGLGGKAVVTTQEASMVLRISERSVRQAIKDGGLPSVRVGRRVLIPVPMLVRLLLGHDQLE